jgi:hypothetical protein
MKGSIENAKFAAKKGRLAKGQTEAQSTAWVQSHANECLAKFNEALAAATPEFERLDKVMAAAMTLSSVGRTVANWAQSRP